MTPGALARVASLLGAEPRGDGSWYAADCPKCGASDSMSLTAHGFQCRSELCAWRGTDIETLVPSARTPAAGTSDLPRAVAAIDATADKLPSYVFDGLAVANEIHVVASDGGVGKTSLLVAIAGAFASKFAALDRFPALTSGPVLFVSEEDTEGLLRNRLEALCVGHGWPLVDVLSRVHLFCLAGVQIDQAHWQHHIHQEVERIGAVAVCFDPWFDLCSGEENSNSDARPAIKFLRQLATKATVFVAAHAGKAAEGKRRIDRIRGASALFSAARVVYFLDLDDRGISVEPLKFSRGEMPKRFVVSRTVETDPDNGAVWRSARLSHLTADAAQEAGAEKLVRAALTEAPGLMTKDLKDHARGTGITAIEVSKAIASLEKRGVITFDPGSQNAKFWRLREPAEDSGRLDCQPAENLPGRLGVRSRSLPTPLGGQAGAGGRTEDPTEVLAEAVE